MLVEPFSWVASLRCVLQWIAQRSSGQPPVGANLRVEDGTVVTTFRVEGPFAGDLADLDRAVGTYLESCFADRMKGAPLLKAISETKFLGKKGGAGFYFYDEKGKETGLNPAIQDLHVHQPVRRIFGAESGLYIRLDCGV